MPNELEDKLVDEKDKEVLTESKKEDSDDKDDKKEKNGKKDKKDKDADDKDDKNDYSKDVDMKEAVDAIFTGAENLSEDFKNKAQIVVKAAVDKRVSEEVEAKTKELQEAFDKKLQEDLSQLEESLNQYTEHLGDRWLDENKIAIESSLKSQLAEDALADIKTVLEKHNIKLPEDQINLAEAKIKEAEVLKEEVSTLTQKLAEKEQEVFTLQKQTVVKNISEGMSVLEQEKLLKLIESVESVEIKDYEDKVKVIKESFFKETKEIKKDLGTTKGTLIEEKTVDPRVDAYAKALNGLK